MAPQKNRKIVTLKKLGTVLRPLKKKGKTVVFTNGCFDIIHAGHVRYLLKAKTLGDLLIVGLNSDASVRQIKGTRRPIVSQQERAEVLAALECVDYITIFDDLTPLSLIEHLEPDILVKGADWAGHAIVGADIVKKKGGRVARMKLARGISTTNIIKKILDLHNK